MKEKLFMTIDLKCKRILLDFYNNWLEHLRLFPRESGYADVGLCRGLRMYISDEFRAEHSLAYSVYGMQLASFENAGLDTTFPFNTAKSFEQECKEKRCMFNEKHVYSGLRIELNNWNKSWISSMMRQNNG
ncbi:hypothetical protein [Escherichia phage BI-EHEC]|nr:hypothetical protein [Escherichia phage BI-EHEC]